MGGTVTELGVVAETVNKQQEREIIYRIAYIHFCKFLSRAFCILNPVFCSPPLSRKLNIIIYGSAIHVLHTKMFAWGTHTY